jgi:hypothetical protein
MQSHQNYLVLHGKVTDECRALVEWLLTSESRRNIEKPAPVPTRPSRISHAVTRDWWPSLRCEKPSDSTPELVSGL